MSQQARGELVGVGEQFEVYRCRLAYPIMPTTVVMRYAVPDLCVWVAWASILARVDGTGLLTGKSTCPCRPDWRSGVRDLCG